MDFQGCWLSHSQRRLSTGGTERTEREGGRWRSGDWDKEQIRPRSKDKNPPEPSKPNATVREFCRISSDIRRQLQGLRSREPIDTHRETFEELPTNRANFPLKPHPILTSRENISEKTEENHANNILSQLCDLLDIHDKHQIIPTVRRLIREDTHTQSLQKALSTISNIVCPEDLEACPEDTIAAVKRWKFDRMNSENSEAADLMQHFKEVFGVKDGENAKEAMNHVFLQLHQMRTFARQTRQLLNLPSEAPLSAVTSTLLDSTRRR